MLFLSILLNIKAQTDSQAVEHPIRKKVVATLAVPLALGTVGMLNYHHLGWPSSYGLAQWRNQHLPNFHTSVDDYLWATPIAAVYGLNFIGVKGRSSFWCRSSRLVLAEAIQLSIVYPAKYLIGELRPDGSEYNSLPSGHTAHAFMAAAFLAKEFRHKSIFYPIVGYTIASSVGTLRVLNNRHYLTDVVVGAGIGILSINLAYLPRFQWQWLEKKGIQWCSTPYFNPSSKSIGLSSSITFG